ncbi:hypothetical protein D7V97_08430 [Corallococcus sp. CA053C]|uniref:hypothetical protein n=1 Tax=Corallococcus sp. CA053C TaxID=2316732 RepID=UPI000EA34DAC|nr:hypothetical protein [Corallococcus sp. CA053C]RKH12452.1 hypothetical protein D7V97_08430 [Corallococcus sp. CA053C]
MSTTAFRASQATHFVHVDLCEWKTNPGQLQLSAAFEDMQGMRYPGDLERVDPRWMRTLTAPTSGTYGIDLWTAYTVALGASSCQFDVLAP